jgi:hypothetical protein
VALAVALLLASPTTPAAIGIDGELDWSMPDRLLVNNRASQSTPGAPVPRYDPDALMVPTNGWLAELDACDVTDDAVVRYVWRVDGDRVGASDTCTFRYRFPSEGQFDVEVRLTNEAGDSARVERRVTIQDWLIVMLGDSYASGEGNPIRPADLEQLEDFGELLDVVQDLNDAVEDAEDFFAFGDGGDFARRSLIDDLEEELDEEQERAARKYLDSLPNWTETPPPWGTAEPTYREIALDGRFPGDALRCHRSMISGQARAALAVERADPRTSVTLVHLACSGARIDEGLIGPDEGQDIVSLLDVLADDVFDLDLDDVRARLDSLDDIPGQIDVAREAVRGREIDAIVISIGGNDLAFSDLVTECAASEPCHDASGPPPDRRFRRALREAVRELCSPATWLNLLTGSDLRQDSDLLPESQECTDVLADTDREGGRAAARFREALALLPGKWRDLDEKLISVFPGLDGERIYLTEYPDITRDDRNNYCGWTPGLASGADRFSRLPGVTEAEWAWADLTVVTSLSDSIEAAAAENRWRFIRRTGNGNGETIESASEPHGYCAEANWIVRLPEAIVAQQQFTGALHPNGAGHDNYHDAIFNALMEDFYPPTEAGDAQEMAPPSDGGEAGGALSEGPEPPLNSPRAPSDEPQGSGQSGGGDGLSGGSVGWPVLLFLVAAALGRVIRKRWPMGQ